MTKLGYNGSLTEKNRMIERMKEHIAKDELVRDEGYVVNMKQYDSDGPDRYVGCSVACISLENLNSFLDLASSYGTKDRSSVLYMETEKLLNIPEVAPLIDVLHESSGDDMKQFNTELVENINIYVDYTNLMPAFLEYIQKEYFPDIYKESDNRMYFRNIFKGVLVNKYHRGIIEDILSPCHDFESMYFIDFLKDYNTKNKVKELVNG